MHHTRPVPVSAPARSPVFDRLSFLGDKTNKNIGSKIGRPYRKQAMELVSICRTFVQDQDQSFNPDADRSLRLASQAVDDALMSSSVAGKGTSEEADKKYELATEMLHSYGPDRHPRDPSHSKSLTVNERMAAAKAKDGERLSTLNRLKEKMVPLKEERNMTVEFLILKSLPDRNPTIVKQVLSEDSNLAEVLWNFSRFRDEKKRLTLKQNPHFYENLPLLPEEYVNNFRCDPIKDFRHERIYVLTDSPSPGRIYLEAGRVPRAFSNVWCPKDALIFQDVWGNIEGEGIVWSSIKEKPNLRYCAERLSSPTLLNSENWKPLQDWTEPIRRLLRSPDHDITNIRIVNCAIDALNDDMLLGIFGSYRLDDDEKWNLQLRWCKLIHVCRRWRQLILGSPSHLNLHLLCTDGTPVADMLDHSPPLPIIINYQNTCATMTPEDEEGILLALQHHNRVRRVVLHTPSQGLHRFLTAMNEHFPILERLSILPITDHNAKLVMPRTFQAPCLSHLALLGVTLSVEPQSLASTVSLVALTLTISRVFVYLPPEDLAAQLQFVPLLEEFSVIFSVLISRSRIQKHAVYTPITRTTLLSLKRFEFRGPSAYVEGLLAQIITPSLRNFDVTLFNQLIFDLSVLSQFISVTADPRSPFVDLNFKQNIISISVCNHKEAQGDKSFYVHVSCKPFDWQVRSAAQICSALGRMLPGVEELSLEFYDHMMPREWRNKVNSRTWYELVRPFKGVKKLCVDHALAFDLSRTLRLEEEPSELLLPALKEIVVEEGFEDDAFDDLIEARQRSDCLIQLVVCPSTRIHSMHSPGPVQNVPIPKKKRPWYEKYLGLTRDGLQSVSSRQA